MSQRRVILSRLYLITYSIPILSCEIWTTWHTLEPALILTFRIWNLHFWFLTFFKGGARQGRKWGYGLLFFWFCDFTLFWLAVPLRVMASRRTPFLLFLFRLRFLPLLSCPTPVFAVWAISLLLPLWWSTVFRRVFSTRWSIWAGRSSPQLPWFRVPLYHLLVNKVGCFLFHLYLIKFRFLSLHSQW